MNLHQHFDAVVMLTWSDWKNEPRSNRYHYATRFARTLPVLFLQHLGHRRDGIAVEASEVADIDIVTVSCALNERDACSIKELLNARGIKRPLLWIYDSLNYQALLDAFPRSMRVYHATEDYLTKTSDWNEGMAATGDSVVRMLAQVDFMVACTQGVARTNLEAGGYKGRYAVIENGCDAEYLLERAGLHQQDRNPSQTSSAIFQGGINHRLDYQLMLQVIQNMPDWEFRFCGAAVASDGWGKILSLPNVRYFGKLSPDEFTRHMCESTVGMIPFVQDQWINNSLPLKAFEYVACGLPVVTVPIAALALHADLMGMASTADEFVAAMRQVAPSRHDPPCLERRRSAALANSYNNRFSSMCESLLRAKAEVAEARSRLKIAVLHDNMGSLHVSTIREHLEAFGKYSRHSITYVPATPDYWQMSADQMLATVDFACFDVIVLHYSIRLSIAAHLDEGMARAVERFNGLKVLFIQDEYEGTEIARRWMERLRFDLVYTCVPQSGLQHVYPYYRFPGTEFLQTLTGYVPEEPGLERYAKPLSDRSLAIAYRGRKLPAVYGELGHQKYRIGVEMKLIAGMRGLPIDIEVDDSKRIYGSAWYQFLGSARATLGTESGANIFDFDGSLKEQIARLIALDPELTFLEISKQVLAPHEGRVSMNQISPKIFEAIRLRTALVLFEGAYSGVIQPDVHFITLKKDFSNIDEVLRKLADDGYLKNLTNQAYLDVVASGRYSYERFVRSVDLDIEARIPRTQSVRVLASLFYVVADGSLKQALPAIPLGLVAGPRPLGQPWTGASLPGFSLKTFVDRVFAPTGAQRNAPSMTSSRLYDWLRTVWHLLPFAIRIRLVNAGRAVRRVGAPKSGNTTILYGAARAIWHLLPRTFRTRLARRLGLG